MQIIRSETLSQFPELVHGFSTREWGNMSYRRDSDGTAKENNRAFVSALGLDPIASPILDPCLTHGNNVAWLKNVEQTYRPVTLNDREVYMFSMIKPVIETTGVACEASIGIDACWTNGTGVYLTMRPADCAIVMLYDPKKGAVGLAHAGTVGILSDIVTHAIDSAKHWFDSKPSDMLCFVGPSISAQAYDLRKSGLWQKGVNRIVDEAAAREYDPRMAIRQQLLACGLHPKHIEISAECTATNPHKYFSHAAAGSEAERNDLGRMLALIGLRKRDG